MLASVLLQHVLAHAPLAGTTGRALKHSVSRCRRAFAGKCNAHTIEPLSAGWFALVTALPFGLSIRDDGVFLSATAILLMLPALAPIRTRDHHAAKATKTIATDGDHA